jgi:hypothetical protein
VVQPTHLLAVVSQNGVSPAHWLSVRHRTHWPSVRQAGVVVFLASHWLDAEQATQTWPAEQMGVAVGHCELVVQPTHLLVVVSQTGVAPEQCLLVVHWTQAPSVRQAPVAAFLAEH